MISLKNDKGFTIFEILIAMFIFSGILFVVSMFILDIFDFGIFLGENIIGQQEIQLTMRLMMFEMRGMAQAANGSYLIESASQNSITFYSDIDGDGITEKIRYFLNGNIMKKGVIKATGSPLTYVTANEVVTDLVHNIYSSAGNIFAYYDSAYSGSQSALTFPVSASVIRMIKVNVTVDPNPNDVSSRVNFATSVNIRNL